MHFSTLATAFTLAVAVTAIPTGGTGPAAPTCASGQAANKCCNSFHSTPLGNLLALVGSGCINIIGSTCTTGNAACCSTQQQGLLNLDICQIAL